MVIQAGILNGFRSKQEQIPIPVSYTHLDVYKRQLVEWYEKGDLDFSEVKTVNLDEYRGLTRDNDQSYY